MISNYKIRQYWQSVLTAFFVLFFRTYRPKQQPVMKSVKLFKWYVKIWD